LARIYWHVTCILGMRCLRPCPRRSFRNPVLWGAGNAVTTSGAKRPITIEQPGSDDATFPSQRTPPAPFVRQRPCRAPFVSWPEPRIADEPRGVRCPVCGASGLASSLKPSVACVAMFKEPSRQTRPSPLPGRVSGAERRPATLEAACTECAPHPWGRNPPSAVPRGACPSFRASPAFVHGLTVTVTTGSRNPPSGTRNVNRS